MPSPYDGQRVALATMHHKERAIAPPMRAHLGVEVVVAPVDTDRLGTFSGEVPREGTMGEVAVRKARLGMQAAGLPLGLASEGTFGPHPVVPFLSAGMELLTFVDDARGLVVHEQLVADETNFARRTVRPGEAIADYLARVGFPTHALIVRPAAGDADAHAWGDALVKGIVDAGALGRAVEVAAARSPDGRAVVETDMRAHLNPTRMRSLAMLAERLAARLATPCPACASPGFGRVGVREGLPCEWCGTPTTMAAADRWRCAACGHAEERPRADGRRTAPAGACPACNP